MEEFPGGVLAVSTLAIGSLEVLRFFRRRSTVWIFVVSFGVVALAYAASILMVGIIRPYFPAAEITNRILMAAQVFGLCGVAWVFAKRSIETEASTGSLTLLVQTPIQGSRILLGKLLGISTILLFGHFLVALLVMLPTPMIRRPHWVFFFYLIGGWLLAVTIVPTGLAEALAGRTGPRRWLRHLSWAIRIVGPVVILQLLILPESKVMGVGVWDVIVQFAGNVVGTSSVSAASHFGGPLVPIIVISSWFALMAIVDWNRAVRSIRR